MGIADPSGPAFRARLKELREARAWSQREVDRRAGWGDDSGFYSRLERGERGKRVSQTVIAKIAQLFGVREQWLVYGEEPRTRASGAERAELSAAIARAEQEHIAPEAIESVRRFEQAATADEATLFQLMLFAHHQLTQALAQKSPLGKKRAARRPKTKEPPAVAAPPKSKRSTGTE